MKLQDYLCDTCQPKLVRYIGEHGVTVHSLVNNEGAWETYTLEVFEHEQRAKAILINIEPIPEPCTHPPEKVFLKYLPSLKHSGDELKYCQCQCGAKVHPTKYEEV